MISLRRVGLVLLYLLFASPPAASGEAVDIPEQAQLTKFDNGVSLLVLARPEKPLVQVNVFFSLRGAACNSGMAHLVEHLMFRSSENCPAGSLADSLQLLTTYHSAFTTPRNIQTNSRCLPGLLPRLLAVEADRFGRLQPDEFDLAHEKNRILGEHDFLMETYTGMALNLRVIAMAYGQEERGDPLLGSPEVIQGIGMAEVDTFITRWIRPDNMVVLVSGPIEPGNVVALAASTFGTIQASLSKPAMVETLQRSHPGEFVTRSGDQVDLLAVGFRLPYGTTEEAAIVHLTETIMERENGNPTLWIFDDEAMLIIHVAGDWSSYVTDQAGANAALKQFWNETRIVKNRVGDNWLFERNRNAHVKDLRRRLGQPYLRAVWRAQSLADDRDLPDPDIMAAMIDSLGQERIREFFATQFTASRAFTAFAAGRTSKDAFLSGFNRRLRMHINPYMMKTSRTMELGVAEIDPILATAVGLGAIETWLLPNGIPVHIRTHPGAGVVYLGGVRTFAPLSGESVSKDPGRLVVYERLANSGYDRRGAGIQPVGEWPGRHTSMDLRVNSLVITAHGPDNKFDSVTAAMHKRINVDRLNPYTFRWLVEDRKKMVRRYNKIPSLRSYSWLVGKIYGSDHPMAGWVRPSAESIADWSTKDANKLHRKLCKTGNFQMVVTGDIDHDTIREKLNSTFARRGKAKPGKFPIAVGSELMIQGAVVHNDTSSIAFAEFMFPPRPLGDDPPLGPVDLMVIEQLLETRLRASAAEAGLDSISVTVYLQSAGPAALPRIYVIGRKVDAERILEFVPKEVARIRDEPPTHSEEARARLQLLGPLIESLMDPESSRDLLLSWGRFGEIPSNPVEDLCRREYGLAGAEAARIFPSDRYVWTLTGDTTWEAIRRLGPIIN